MSENANPAARRRSKIAHLPEPIRSHVNELLESQTPYHQICDWLARQGHPGISDDTISRWKNGGFLDWFKAHERLEQIELKRVDASKLVQVGAQEFVDANEDITELAFYDALNRAETDSLAELINTNPKEFIALLKTFTHFRRYRLHRERFREYLRQQRRREEQESKPNGGGVRTETLTHAKEFLAS